MIVLNEGFWLVREKEKLFDCTAILQKTDTQYVLSINNKNIAEIKTSNEQMVYRFAITELSHLLVSFIEKMKDISNLEVVTHPQNRLFYLKAVRCQHIRPKGLLKGNVCNKLIFNGYSSNRLGGRIFCPRCQNLSYV